VANRYRVAILALKFSNTIIPRESLITPSSATTNITRANPT
jgi:hypothetical protein